MFTFISNPACLRGKLRLFGVKVTVLKFKRDAHFPGKAAEADSDSGSPAESG